MSTISSSTTSSTAYKVAADTTGTLVLQTGATPTTAVTIDGSQNVLVGGTTQYGGAKITISNGGAYLALNSTSGGYSLIRGFDSGTERWSVGQIGFGGTDGMAFYTGASNTERARIDSSGNLLVGTTTTPGAGSATTGVGLLPGGAITAQRGGATACYFGRSNDGEVVALYSGTTQRGTISISGATTTYGSVSDYRLKENVVAISSGLSKVMALKPSTFNFIEFPDKNINGFIAHEVAEVEPIAVTGKKDAVDEDGKLIFQSVDAAKLVPLLTAAIQEQQALITQLQADVAALKG